MHVAISPVFGAHVVQVITGGELAPVFQNVFVPSFVALQDGRPKSIQLLTSIPLHGVPQPRGQISLRIRPRDHLRRIPIPHRGESIDGLRAGHKFILTRIHIKHRFRQFFQERKNASLSPLVLTECLVVHEEIAQVAIPVDAIEPTRKSFCSKGPFGPTPIRKTESDVVA